MFLDDIEDYISEIKNVYQIKETNFSVKFLFIPLQG